MGAQAIVILCPNRPQVLFNQPVLGHVGWGYEYPDGSWGVGSSEAPWRGISNGFWSKRLPDLASALEFFSYNMTKLCGAEYNYYKGLEVNSDVTPNPSAADQTVAWISQQPYILTGRNCMNDTFDVLMAFAGGQYNGTQIPSPQNNWIPNGWFNAIVTNEYCYLPAAPPTNPNESCEFGTDQISSIAIHPAPPPPWRVVGDPSFIPLAQLDPTHAVKQPVVPPNQQSPHLKRR